MKKIFKWLLIFWVASIVLGLVFYLITPESELKYSEAQDMIEEMEIAESTAQFDKVALGFDSIVMANKTEKLTALADTFNLAKDKLRKKALMRGVQTLKTGAYLTAKGLIESSLKAPSTAKFATYGYGDNPATVDYYEDGTYVVNIWVDAQNSFGAMLRNKYKVSLKIVGERWDLIDISKLD